MLPRKSQEIRTDAPADDRRRRGPLERQVRDALMHVHDPPYLAVHPLAPRDQPDSARAGRALQQRLFDAVAALRPEGNGAVAAALRRHQLMTLRYVEGLEIAEVCAQLGLGLSQYHREHGPALAAVAAAFAVDVPDVGAMRLGPARYGTPFVGRDAELGMLTSQLEAVRSGGAGRFVLVWGEPGVGKTRLARELGALAGARGAVFLEGAYPREVADAYALWADILRGAVRNCRPAEVAELVGADGAELGSICPELFDADASGRGTTGPGAALASARDRRRRLFDAVAALLLRGARKAPLVLLLDDLQWAPDLALVVHVFQRLAENRVLVVATARRADLVEQPALARAWSDFARSPTVSALFLMPLSEEASARIVAQRLGTPSPAFAAQVHQRARGNAFFIEQLLDSLEEQGVLTAAAGTDAAETAPLPMPDSVRRLVVERVARLGAGAPQALAQAALLRQPCAFQVLLGMTGRAEGELLDTVDQAVASGLLVDRSTDTEERYAFADDQLQEALLAGIASPRRRRYHQRAGKAIEVAYAERLEPHVEELASHFDAAGEVERAAAYELQAGRKTERLFAWSQSLAYYRSALDRLEALGGHLGERAELCERLGGLCYTSGVEAARAGEYLERALALYEQSGDNQRAAGVHSMLGLAYLAGSHYAARRTDLAAEYLGRARELLASGAPTAALAVAEARLAIAHLALIDVPPALESAGRAVELAERLGEGAALVEACTALGSALAWAGAVGDGLATMERAWRLVEGQPLPAARDALAMNGVIVATCLKEPRLGLTWAARTTEPGQQTALGRLMVPGYVAAVHALSGELAAGMGLLAELRRDWEGTGQPEFARQPAAVGLLLLRQGSWDEAQALLEAGAEWARDCRYHWLATMSALRLGELFIETGEHAAAEEQLRAALERARAGECVLVELGVLPVLAQAEVGLGRLAAAEQHLAAARAILTGGEWGGLAAEVGLAEGLLWATRDRWHEAEDAFAGAAEGCRAHGLRWDEARVCETWGGALAERSRDADGTAAARARDMLGRAASTWDAMGAERYAERCRQRLARWG